MSQLAAAQTAELVGASEKIRLIQSELTAQQERNINLVEEYQGACVYGHVMLSSKSRECCPSSPMFDAH